MKTYELLYIVPGQYTDAEIEGIRAKVVKLVEKIDGKILRHDNLGKIRLAYTIDKVQHGTYILIYFDLESHDFSILDREMKMDKEILRHMVTTAPKGAVDRQYEISSYVAPLSEEAREAKNESNNSFSKHRSNNHSSTPETITPAVKEVTPVVVEDLKELEPPVPAVKEENLSVEELDKKLDEILDKDISKSL